MARSRKQLKSRRVSKKRIGGRTRKNVIRHRRKIRGGA